MAEAEKQRKISLHIVPGYGHRHESKKYLKAENNAIYRKSSFSTADDASMRKLNNLYEGCGIGGGSIFGRPPQIVRQSPIDIRLSKTVYDPKLATTPLTVHYPRNVENFVQLRNTGHTWKLRVGDNRFRLSGGPLQHQYQLDQVHAHWGPDNVVGSEHMINHYQYAGELHFVHWNSDKCKTIDEAVSNGDGLAVLGVFLKLGKPHPEIEKLTNALKDILYCDKEISLDNEDVNIVNLLPKDISQYWTYDGSLTTPPYNDCVVWIVLKNHLEVSAEQMSAMRSMFCHSEGQDISEYHGHTEHEHSGPMVHNYRPVQLQSRVNVRSSFKPVLNDLF